jgi:hypothetical protein
MAVLGVRLLALYFFMHHLSILPWALAPHAALDWPSWLTVLYPLTVAALLWSGAGPLASLILPRRTAAPEPAPASLSDWYGLAFAVVGLLVTLNALPALLRIALEVHGLRREFLEVSSAHIVTAAVVVLQLALGLAALLGSRGLSRVIARLRTANFHHSLD